MAAVTAPQGLLVGAAPGGAGGCHGVFRRARGASHAWDGGATGCDATRLVAAARWPLLGGARSDTPVHPRQLYRRVSSFARAAARRPDRARTNPLGVPARREE